MAQISPFKGLRYNLNLISDISLVTSPPYDVISPQRQKLFYEKHQNNVIRLILGMEQEGDNETNNKYTRARDFYNTWIMNNILTLEDKPCIYLYSQEYRLKDEDEIKTRHGFISLVKLEDFSKGIICPHEQTLSAPKKDRLELMRHCKTNFSQIFGLYTDKNFHIEEDMKDYYETVPLIKVIEDDGIVSLLWKISEPEVINQITSMMKDKVIVIADGHHRYETALDYCNERKQNNPAHSGLEPYNYVMFMLVNTLDPGLTILPTHRLIHNLPELDINKLINQLKEYFDVSEVSFENIHDISYKMHETGKTKHTFGLYIGGNKYFLLILKDERLALKYSDQTKSEIWRKLDVSILQNLIIERFLDVGHHHLKEGKHVVYSHDTEECIQRVNSKEFQLAFFLNPTKNKEVVDISGRGELMPQKSTYFYPKLLTGLVIYSVRYLYDNKNRA